MVLPCVTLVGFLVPVLVTPLGLLALRVLGVVVIYKSFEISLKINGHRFETDLFRAGELDCDGGRL